MDAFCRLSWSRSQHEVSNRSGSIQAQPENVLPTSTVLSADNKVADNQPTGEAAAGVSREQRSPRRLIYLSCGWPALKRDAAALLGLRSVAPQPTFAGAESVDPVQTEISSSHPSKSKKRNRYRKKKKSHDPSTGGSRTGTTTQVWAEGDTWESCLGEGVAAKWRLLSATAFLFFPGTDAIETLAVFEEVV